MAVFLRRIIDKSRSKSRSASPRKLALAAHPRARIAADEFEAWTTPAERRDAAALAGAAPQGDARDLRAPRRQRRRGRGERPLASALKQYRPRSHECRRPLRTAELFKRCPLTTKTLSRAAVGRRCADEAATPRCPCRWRRGACARAQREDAARSCRSQSRSAFSAIRQLSSGVTRDTSAATAWTPRFASFAVDLRVRLNAL